jgi:hypothetical protein
MKLEQFKEEMREILNSQEYLDLTPSKRTDYRGWLLETMKHPDRYQHVIHKIKYKLGILRSQKAKRDEVMQND